MLLFIYIVVLSTVDSAVRVVVRFVVHNTESAITEEFSMGGGIYHLRFVESATSVAGVCTTVLQNRSVAS